MPERRITVAHGDGIGPEIMDATLRVLEAGRAPLACDRIAVGEQAYRQGHTSGIAPDAWATIRRNGVLLKAPITTPQGGGYKSLNVTIRKALNLFANVRPVKSYAPFVAAPRSAIDLVIIREDEEDLYAGIEHQQTADVTQVLKLITYREGGISVSVSTPRPAAKSLVGMDVFLDWDVDGRDAATLGRTIEATVPAAWRLKMITNRGVKVYPDGLPETCKTDHWRCRFMPAETAGPISFDGMLGLLAALHQRGLDIIKTEHLYTMDGQPAFSLGQGE